MKQIKKKCIYFMDDSERKRNAIFFEEDSRKRNAIFFEEDSRKRNAIFFWENDEEKQLNMEKREKNNDFSQHQQNVISSGSIVNDVKEESLTKANFVIRAVNKVIIYNRDGMEVEAESYIVIEIIFDINGKHLIQRMEISVTELDSVITKIKKKFSFAVVGNRVDEIINDLRIQTFDIPVIKVCREAGWNKINKEWKYCFKGLDIQGYDNRINLQMNINKGSLLTDDSKNLWDALHVYKEQGSASILVLFSLLGVLYKVFEMAGYPIRFLLFVKGQTGSFKTSIAKVLYMQLTQAGFDDIPRRLDQDTETSLERALVHSGTDTVILFDDFRPPKNESQKNKLQNNLETVIRMVGDGVSKNRSNSNLDDVRGGGVKGCVVVTGEIKAEGHSSNLRCLFIDIKKRYVDTQCLSRLQADRGGYNMCVWRFTEFVSTNWNTMIANIQNKYPILRQEYSAEIKEARLVDAMVTLHITLDILQVYCMKVLNWQEKQIQFLDSAREDIFNIVKLNDSEGVEQDPVDNFMSALQYLVVNNVINVVNNDMGSEAKMYSDGINDGEYIYLKPQNAYNAVIKHLKGIGVLLHMGYSDLFKKLLEQNIICGAKHGVGRISPYFRRKLDNENRITYIKISKKILFDYKEN